MLCPLERISFLSEQLSARLLRTFPRMLQRTATISASARRLATTLSAGGTGDPAAYCRSLVQKHDYESYLCSHFYPRERQPGFFALKAFFVRLSFLPSSLSLCADCERRSSSRCCRIPCQTRLLAG